MSKFYFQAIPHVGLDTFLVVNHLFIGGNIFSDAWEYIVAKRIADVLSAQPHNRTSHKRKDSSKNCKKKLESQVRTLSSGITKVKRLLQCLSKSKERVLTWALSKSCHTPPEVCRWAINLLYVHPYLLNLFTNVPKLGSK